MCVFIIQALGCICCAFLTISHAQLFSFWDLTGLLERFPALHFSFECTVKGVCQLKPQVLKSLPCILKLSASWKSVFMGFCSQRVLLLCIFQWHSAKQTPILLPRTTNLWHICMRSLCINYTHNTWSVCYCWKASPVKVREHFSAARSSHVPQVIEFARCWFLYFIFRSPALGLLLAFSSIVLSSQLSRIKMQCRLRQLILSARSEGPRSIDTLYRLCWFHVLAYGSCIW